MATTLSPVSSSSGSIVFTPANSVAPIIEGAVQLVQIVVVFLLVRSLARMVLRGLRDLRDGAPASPKAFDMAAGVASGDVREVAGGGYEIVPGSDLDRDLMEQMGLASASGSDPLGESPTAAADAYLRGEPDPVGDLSVLSSDDNPLGEPDSPVPDWDNGPSGSGTPAEFLEIAKEEQTLHEGEGKLWRLFGEPDSPYDSPDYMEARSKLQAHWAAREANDYIATLPPIARDSGAFHGPGVDDDGWAGTPSTPDERANHEAVAAWARAGAHGPKPTGGTWSPDGPGPSSGDKAFWAAEAEWARGGCVGPKPERSAFA